MPEELNIPEGQSEKGDQSSEELKETVLHRHTGSQDQTPEPQTSNMEIHPHPDLHHRKKPWREYIKEEGAEFAIELPLNKAS